VAGCSGRLELGRLDGDGADIPVPPHEHAHRATEGLADHESLQVRHVLDRMNVYLARVRRRKGAQVCHSAWPRFRFFVEMEGPGLRWMRDWILGPGAWAISRTP
jgi:hypothetical protein